MCEYCDANITKVKPIYDWNLGDGHDYVDIWLENKNIEVEVASDGLMACETAIPINYCPKCGRKLNEKNS